ncbi:MAG: DUF790 family protein [Deltaproteobacteria bacterium]|nr:DUF790 family protein [Deltaproteobacteria bacterium]
MLPERLIRPPVESREITPRYLDERDYLWLRALLDAYKRFVGRRRAELDQHLFEPLPVTCPQFKKAQAIAVLDKLCRDRTAAPLSPKKVRETLFTEAARGDDKQLAIDRACDRLAIKGSCILDYLFADLPRERRVAALPAELNVSQLALRVNLVLAQSMIARAQSLAITLHGNSRDIVRYARLRGLLCAVRVSASRPHGEIILEISGPFALFKRTLVYARELASLVPRLAWCDRFELRARCLFRDASPLVVIRAGDPIFPTDEPRRFDSRLEERFFSDFSRLATDWDVVREPKPIRAQGKLIFPDFALVHRRDRNRYWLLEIVGYWTADYLKKKLADFRSAGLSNLILCIDEKRDCADEQLPLMSRLVLYRNRIEAQRVLDIIDPGAC